MATNQAAAADVTRRMLRPLTDAETAFVPTALDDAFQQLLVRAPGLAGKLDDPTIPDSDPIRLLTVATQCAMVKRVLINPDGILEESVDEGAYTRRLDAAISTGQIAPTDLEIETLTVAIGSPEGAFSVRAQPDRAAWWQDAFPTTSTDTWAPGSLRFQGAGGRIW